ncbi:LytTR family transcriptional regulator [Aggregatimonas sangjinii]|uniref:LytTR family transcriptional regulator n=1 Tax=Aggregatimonas sangjinii TaxID=2583587 RepID=A0A5B7SWK0_9FLAO|nr:LytTR family DNA-binding domain-containing protein [Aggregatimonas sangjinii]QCX01563.1 LytTR family transcriptional regulator [Aggregatimonas sangjinii]
MNHLKFSTKWLRLDSLWERILFWGVLLLSSAWTYYDDFYALFPAFLLALAITAEVIGMLLIGYFVLSKHIKFPRLKFWSWVFLFTLLRFAIVYFILQHKLPEWTVFHYPGRSVFFLFFTSAAFVFLGYAYSIYEWGLAAREKYKAVMVKNDYPTLNPIVIRSEGRTLHLLPQDVSHLQANGEYINYFTGNGNHMAFQRMKKAETELKPYGFIRTHRSFIVNPNHIRSFSSNEIELKDGTVIPVSKTYQGNLLLIDNIIKLT